eukprot:m.137948 g.137948  ORF g.137948 m.137948 type:complete len:286 (-) comp17589_c0_seq3:279-1136(-)
MGDSGFGGGGFMGGGGTPSSQSPAGGDKKDRISTMTPLTIHQIHSAELVPPDTFKVDKMGVGQVSVIGVVRSVEAKATKISYSIEDHTGTIDVTRWVDEGSEDGGDSDAREGMYVHVFGTLKSYQDTRSISAHKVFPITDANEITMHLLDALFNHLRWTRGILGDDGKPVPVGVVAAAANAGGGEASSFIDARGQARGNDQYSMGGGGGGFGGQSNSIGGTPVQNEVLDVLKRNDADTGTNINDICNELSSKYTATDIRDAIDWLGCEGHVYSTIDEDHFRATDS